MRLKMAFCLMLILLLSMPVFAIDSWNMTKLDEMMDFHFGILDMVKSGDLVITCSRAGGIHFFDVSDPNNLQILNSFNLPDLETLEVQGDNVYAVESHYSGDPTIIYSINISDVNNPVLQDTLQLDVYRLENIEVEGSTIYLTKFDGYTGTTIYTIDISDPSDISYQGENVFDNLFLYFTIFESQGYFIDSDGQLCTIDISDPANLTVTSEVLVDENILFGGSIVLDDNYFYVIAGSSLYVLDRDSYSIIGTFVTYETNTRPYLDGSVLVCSAYSSRVSSHHFNVFDISDPSEPILVNRLEYGFPESFGLIEENIVYLVTLYGLTVYALDDQYQVAGEQSLVELYERLTDFTIDGNIAYLKGEKVHIVDISEIGNEEIIGTIDESFREFVKGSNKLLGIKRGGYPEYIDSLYIYQEVPGQVPELLSMTLFDHDFNYDEQNVLQVQDEVCYLVERNTTLYAYDISEPESGAELMTSISVNCDVFRYTVRGNYIYAVRGIRGDTYNQYSHYLNIYELADGTIEEVAQLDLGEFIAYHEREAHFCLEGSSLYVSGERRFGIIDISNPQSPIILYHEEAGNGVNDLHVQNGYLLQTTDRGIRSYLVSNPSAPEPTGYYNDPMYKGKFQVGEDGTLYLLGETHILVLEAQNALYTDEDQESDIPGDFIVLNAYPNPFNASMEIKVEIPARGHLNLAIYNLLGREVNVLTDKVYNQGVRQFVFNGSSLSSGTYFIKATLDKKNPILQKVTLMK